MEFSFHFVAVLLLVFACLAAWYFFDRKRSREIKAWAKSRGLNFTRGPDPALGHRYPDLVALQRGDGGWTARNIAEGDFEGRKIVAFDYRYERWIPSEKEDDMPYYARRFSAVIIDSDKSLERLFVEPVGIFNRVAEIAGFEMIRFESHEFNRRFVVRATDRAWAFDVLHPRAMQLLLDAPPLSMQFGGLGKVICWGSNRWSPRQFELAVRAAAGILDLIPDYVWEKRKRST